MEEIIKRLDRIIELLEEKKKPKKKNEIEKNENAEIWEIYKNAYLRRYGIEPPRNATINSQIKNFRKRLSLSDCKLVIEFYLNHNDSYYLKNSHSFGLCLKDAENLYSQMMRGVQITQSKINSYNRESKYNDLLEDIKRNGI